MIDISTLGLVNNVASNTYFVDPATYFVYSRKTGAQTRLSGSLNVSNVRSYTLQTTGRYPVKIREDRLRQAVAAAVRNKTRTEGEVNTGKGWIIGSVINGQYSFSTSPVVHSTESSVDTEIERLAKNNPGTRFVKVRIEAFVQSGVVSWS